MNRTNPVAVTLRMIGGSPSCMRRHVLRGRLLPRTVRAGPRWHRVRGDLIGATFRERRLTIEAPSPPRSSRRVRSTARTRSRRAMESKRTSNYSKAPRAVEPRRLFRRRGRCELHRSGAAAWCRGPKDMVRERRRIDGAASSAGFARYNENWIREFQGRRDVRRAGAAAVSTFIDDLGGDEVEGQAPSLSAAVPSRRFR